MFTQNQRKGANPHKSTLLDCYFTNFVSTSTLKCFVLINMLKFVG